MHSPENLNNKGSERRLDFGGRLIVAGIVGWTMLLASECNNYFEDDSTTDNPNSDLIGPQTTIIPEEREIIIEKMYE